MRQVFDWLIEHEKYLLVVTSVLLVALVVQLRFCGSRVGSEVRVVSEQAQPTPAVQPSASPVGLTGIWDMSVQKKSGGVQNWTLTLTQEGDSLSGVLTSEGGDLPVNGHVKGNQISLSAHRFGATVDFPATFDGKTMTGTMRALMITRQWSATRR